MLDVPHELVPVEFYPGREHESAEFKKINPLGHIPVIDDDGFILRDAHAILIYLACRFDPARTWYPTGDPRLVGEVASWLQFAEGTSSTASAARLCVNFGYDFDLKSCRAGAHRLFRVLDEHIWSASRKGSAGSPQPRHPPSPTSRSSPTLPSPAREASHARTIPPSDGGPSVCNACQASSTCRECFPWHRSPADSLRPSANQQTAVDDE